MFKLESYLTPLLLNYVDKYIKNLKPEDSQFSLWGGDAVFSNLDLRLDVLEEELQLPFVFVNGHIHELRIHVPWTKLGSEPVVITINTIECILKLNRENDGADSEGKKVCSPKAHQSSKHLKKPDEMEAPPGYVQSLINRVIGNICIVCNNLVFKYVEDDIVLSLNIKSIELFSVNEKWEQSFVDMSLADTVVRKIVQMQDLTVCLDKRDGCGKIETYQDPLLYRCSSTWRLYSVYSTPHSKYPSLTKINMFCDGLDFSLTDQQLPMFIRLLSLCVALHNKSLISRADGFDPLDDKLENNHLNFEENNEDLDAGHIQKGTWGSWAWSLIPDVLPTWDAGGSEDEMENELNMLRSKKVFQFGIYIGKASCTFKQTVGVQDSSCCSSKCAFSSLMVANQYGCSMEFTTKAKDFINMQIGISGATVNGVEDCVCGHQDFSNCDKQMNSSSFLKSGVPPGSGHPYSYLSSSLFDPLAPENCGQKRNYCFSKEEHLSIFTEECMVERFPAFALDYIYELIVPEEWQDKISTITTCFLEESNWQESSTCRLVFGPLCADITSSLVHRLSKFICCTKDYDYPAYSSEFSRNQSMYTVDVKDDIIKQLEEFVPVRQYHITLFKPAIRLSFADHPTYNASLKSELRKSRKKNKRLATINTMKGSFKNPFCLEIYAECVDMQMHFAMYPHRLANIVKSMIKPSQLLLHHCYTNYTLKLFGFEMSLHSKCKVMDLEPSIVEPLCLTFFKKALTLPENWGNSANQTIQEHLFECSTLSIQFSEFQFLAILSIYQSWFAKHFDYNELERFQNATEVMQSGLPHLLILITDIKCQHLKTDAFSVYKAAIDTISVKFFNKDNLSVIYHAPESTSTIHEGVQFQSHRNTENCKKDVTNNQIFCQLFLQIPKDIQDETPLLLVIYMSGSTICLEPALLSFLSFEPANTLKALTQEAPMSCNDLDNESFGSSPHETSVSQSFSKSVSSTTNSNEYNSLHKDLENILLKYSGVLTHVILQVEIGNLSMLLPRNSWAVQHALNASVIQSWTDAFIDNRLHDSCIFCFPKIKIKNNCTSNNWLLNFDVMETTIPVSVVKEAQKSAECFPWTAEIDNLSLYTVTKHQNITFILSPFSVSMTIALTVKSNHNQLGLGLHMDSKAVNFSLTGFQTELLVNCLHTICEFSCFFKRMMLWISCFTQRFPDVSINESLHQDSSPPVRGVKEEKQDKNAVTHIEKFGSCSDSCEDAENKAMKKLTLWAQLTLSKLNIALLGTLQPNTNENFKVEFDGEEIILSLDIHEVYSKVKLKLSSLSVNCFVKGSQKSTWEPAPYDGVILSCNDMVRKSTKSSSDATRTSSSQHARSKSDNQPFLTATYTCALRTNARQKWTSKLNQNVQAPTEGVMYISEIDLKVKSFDFILWMSVFDVMNQLFFPLLKTFEFCTRPSSINSNEDKLKGISFCSQNLPLLYVEANIIRLFIPKRNIQNQKCMQDNTKLFDGRKKVDVLQLQLDCILVSSQVENPLPRIILDNEIYTAAINSKTIALPGAAVEDRQYQVDICGLAFFSVNGCNILSKNYAKREMSFCHPPTMGENPALEWNIGVIKENRTVTKENLLLTIPIMSPINIHLAVAPAMVCNNSSKNEEKLMVAGISLEISVTSDINLYLSVQQVHLVASILKDNFSSLLQTFNESETKNLKDSNLIPNEINSKSCVTNAFPSVLPCFTHCLNNFQEPLKKSEESEASNFIVPFEILVTAGTVSVMLFCHEEDFINDVHTVGKNTSPSLPNEISETNEEENNHLLFDSQGDSAHNSLATNLVHSENNDNEKNNSLFDLQGDSTHNFRATNLVHSEKNIKIYPFLCVLITQPHTYILCHLPTQKFEIACFDMQVHGSLPGSWVEKTDRSFVPVVDDYEISYLKTKPGEPNEKTGIPPAFCTITCTDFLKEPADIKLCIERPVKFSLQVKALDSFISFLNCYKNAMLNQNICLHNANSDQFKAEGGTIKSKLCSKFQKLSLTTAQLVFEIAPLKDDEDVKLIFSADSIKVEATIESYEETLKRLDVNMNTSSFTFVSFIANQAWNFLQPLSFSTVLKCHINPWFQLETYALGDSLIFNFSLHHLLSLNTVINKISELIQNFFQSKQSQVAQGTENILPSNLNDNHINRCYWNDDLRKGSFQFIQVCEAREFEPKVNQIVFSRAFSSQPAAMTWRYPEPRTLIKVEVSPVPFHCEVAKTNEVQVLICYLQYWNAAHHEFENLCHFMLSETEHCSLNLEQNRNVSDTWRVLLECRSYIDDNGVIEKASPCLSPLALAACMCIDSCFDPYLIPLFQVNASLEMAKIKFYNYCGTTGFTPSLYPFEFDDASPINQEFMLISFSNPNCSCAAWSSKINGKISSGLNCDILEYRNLTLLPLISPVDVCCNISIASESTQPPVVDVEMVLQPCFVRVSQSVIHTLAFTLYSHLKEFNAVDDDQKCCEYILPNYFFICNNIHESIRFGQIDTEESVILSPLKMHAYSWWCQKKKQLLRISLGSSQWKWSEAFAIDRNGSYLVQLERLTIVINIKPLSNLQKQVIIDGQLIVHNQLNIPIQLKVYIPVPSSQLKSSTVQQVSFIKSVATKSSTPSFILSNEQFKQFQISLTGILDSQIWSEKISPCGSTMVKIPWKENCEYQNVWCQSHHKKFHDRHYVTAVFICPLYVLHNNLPFPICEANMKSLELEDFGMIYEGKGKENVFFNQNEEGSGDSFYFQALSENLSPLSSISIDVKHQTDITSDEKVDAQHICDNLISTHFLTWPYSFLERPLKFPSFIDSLCACTNNALPYKAAIPTEAWSSKLTATVKPRWKGLNTILIDVKPSLLLVNRLGSDLYIFDTELLWILPPNSVAMLSSLQMCFKFAVRMKGQYYFSCPLEAEDMHSNYSSESTASNCDSFSTSQQCSTKVPLNSSISICITIRADINKLCLLKLKSEITDGINVISVFPLVSVMNKSKIDLHLALQASFCKVDKRISVNERSNLQCLNKCSHFTEPLLFWEEILNTNSDQTVNISDLFLYLFLSEKSDDPCWSLPALFHLNLPNDSRHFVAVPTSEHTTLPLVLTCHRRLGMLFLIIDNDRSSLLLIHNRTNFCLAYGQSCLVSGDKSIHDSALNSVPVLKPGCSSHYTFPEVGEQFPLPVEVFPMICLGTQKHNNQEIVWSLPFKTDLDKLFVHIPEVCDVMIRNVRLGHTTNLYIDPVNRIEFTAKEIRTRIVQATGSVEDSENKPSKQKNIIDSDLKAKVNSGLISKFACEVQHRKQLLEPPCAFCVNIRVIHVSVVVCDELKNPNGILEVLRLNIDNAVIYSRPKGKNSMYQIQEFSITFQNVQLDNQLNNDDSNVYDFPVVFQRYIDLNTKSNEIRDYDMFLPNQSRENSFFVLNMVLEIPLNFGDAIVFQSFNMHAQPMSVYLEDVFYYQMIRLYNSFTSPFHHHHPQWTDNYLLQEIETISSLFAHPMFFEQFQVNIPEISLSVHASLKLYLSLEHSLLRFQPFEKTALFTTSHELGRIFVLHYLTGALFRAGWVVGSLDILGNPAGFARAVSLGMSDFLQMPYKGLLHGPKAFAAGLSNGALSLFTQISSGAITCMASLASSISKNMDFLCLDTEHLARQELLRRQLPQGLSDGLIQGLSGFGLSLLSAVAGIVDHPLQVLIHPSTPLRTATGVVSGLGKGILGVFTKPIGGVAELLSQTGYGILHGAGWINLPKRQYQPIVMSMEAFPSSCVKYLSKITQCMSVGEVLLSLDATYLNEQECYEKNILLLTSEALCFLKEDEVTIRQTFALSEIDCKSSPADQSTLIVVYRAEFRRQIVQLESGASTDRVLEYLKKTSDIATSLENSSCLPPRLAVKTSSFCHKFFLYPKDRNLFLNLFSHLKKTAMGKGFCVKF